MKVEKMLDKKIIRINEIKGKRMRNMIEIGRILKDELKVESNLVDKNLKRKLRSRMLLKREKRWDDDGYGLRKLKKNGGMEKEMSMGIGEENEDERVKRKFLERKKDVLEDIGGIGLDNDGEIWKKEKDGDLRKWIRIDWIVEIVSKEENKEGEDKKGRKKLKIEVDRKLGEKRIVNEKEDDDIGELKRIIDEVVIKK